MAYFTKDEARKAARDSVRKSFSANAKAVLDSISKTTSSYDSFDVFLSHSSKDAELVLGVKILLENCGLRVYVDWFDDSLASRDEVSSETAEMLRERMNQSKSLILVATNNSCNSKWMPWELGYFDGFSGGNVAILPLVDDPRQTFDGQEYLGLYPLVDKDQYSDSGAADTFVKKENGWKTLHDFGSGSKTWYRYRNAR